MNRISVRASVALALLAVHANGSAAGAVTLDAARRTLASGDAVTAVPMYEALTQQGESLEAELGLVRAALQAGEFRKAMSWATLTAGEHKDSAESIALLAYLQDRVGHTEQALRELKRLRTSQPAEAVGIAAHADILIDRVGASQARALLDEWMGKDPQRRSVDLLKLVERADMAGGASAGAAGSTRISAGDGGAVPAAGGKPTLASSTGATSGSAGGVWPRPSFEQLPVEGKRVVGGGNGVVVDEGTHVLTYAALLPEGATIYVRNGLGKVRRAERVAGDRQSALVRLRLVEPYPSSWALPKDQIVSPEGTRFCFALGYSVPRSPEATYPAVAPGLVFRADAGVGGLMQITSAQGAGHAGSPVFDPRGRLIGIATGAGDITVGGKNLRGQVGAGTFALRVVAAQAGTSKNAAAPASPAGPMPPMPAIEELYERLTPSVVQIVALR